MFTIIRAQTQAAEYVKVVALISGAAKAAQRKVVINQSIAGCYQKGTPVAHHPDMQCYFGSYRLPDNNGLDKSAVVIFHIPELGIRFKAPFDGIDDHHNDFAALLALLEFIDSNQKYMSESSYQIYCHNRKLVDQLNLIEPLPPKFLGLFEKTRNYQKKYRFSLSWVTSDRNSALENLYD